MLAYIKGSLESKMKDYIIIDVAGLGYKVFMSENAIEKVGDIGQIVKVHTYYRVKEDDISIFGFITSEELAMFELLITVSGVGAKTALATLAVIEPSQFALAVIMEDVATLTKIPGIGPKSAKRIILELKDKVKKEQKAISADNVEIKQAVLKDDDVCEAVSALMVLGYSKKEVEDVVGKIDKNGLSVEDIIKKGLVLLSRL